MRANSVKRTLKSGQPSVGTWLSLGSIPGVALHGPGRFYWLTVDIEHSLVGWETAVRHMFAAIADAGCMALARVPSNRHDHIKRVRDNGAHGIVVPMVNSPRRKHRPPSLRPCIRRPAIAASAAAFTLSISTRTATDYLADANDEIFIVLQCEHIQAVQNADAIFSVPGIDAIFVGPNDLSQSMRAEVGKPPSAAATREAYDAHPGHVQEGQGCRRHPLLLHRRSEAAHRRGLAVPGHHQRIGMMMQAAEHVVKKLGLRMSGGPRRSINQ